MNYISTRGAIAPIGFKDAVMMGLATDGGLLLPETIPALGRNTLESWQSLSYQDLAFNVISLFADDIPAQDLKDLIDRSYATFSHPEITPVVEKDGVYILELFHGPTLAFKDVALQLLGNLFEYLLKERGEKMNIVGATSGDTGSAAIYGVRGKDKINIFILHPHGKTSPVQALQMTTVLDPNVHNIAARGTFDDCQNIVKSLFSDLPFKEKYSLGAVNSINWARVLAQVVYYFYAYFRVAALFGQEVVFSVPTGNFGDIFAGYVAKRMGLPIRRLILATNENNILSRFINGGDYSLGDVVATVSPSMDIQLASNFERYVYYLFGENPARVREAFAALPTKGRIDFTEAEMEKVRDEFLSRSVNEDETIATIAAFHRETGYILDPHTAVGVKAALELVQDGTPAVCLATAHPAKFAEAVVRAVGFEPSRPTSLEGIEALPSRCDVLDADRDAIKAFIEKKAL
ncbi:threonine synthase [Geobacter metallireducens RCH3]|uniref:Threonine synthase n=1 Tax=Geobacter metallireducens (strain ATCC 53774 / DSM 7210 / GS-15) TaxID=269799 RepID=Q39V62_GEOMG|nr:threonine synthase [Geobacter metallireducens]ABB31862.1 threonine synthase [Geobacter metallireducens GS-15]EHP89254.1 threonine synthase [Geobacter metallireducens RCH3]